MNCQFSSRPGPHPGRATLPRSRNFFFDHGSAGASPYRRCPGQRGVALVITLVLLVVITTLAVAFLALSYRETASVAGAAATTDAAHAADAALERAQAQMKAQLIRRNTVAFGSDVMGPDLMISVARDVPNDVPNATMNVLGNAWANGGVPLNNLRADAAPPVFAWLAKASNSTAFVQLRDYLDLNRNGRFEPTGFLTNLLDNGSIATDANGLPIVEWRVGDPQWVGVLRDPTRPHGPDNHFIARYAFIILPAGRSLDVNWIHNDTKNVTLGAGFTGYFRNQGIGSYELNLAAFLADVSSKTWPTYNFVIDPNPAFGNSGLAFLDAYEVLTNRYRFGNKANLAPATQLFASLGPMGINYFPLDHINAYADGPLAPFGSSVATAALPDGENPARPWPGADSHRHYFTIHDFWNGNELPGFAGRLAAASAGTSSEDRYTYYRILAQLGTDSPAERDDRLNINYKNYDATNTASLKGYATNLVPWTATEFFYAAADRLLTNEFFPYGVTNIGLLDGRTIPIYARTNSALGGLSVFGYPITNAISGGMPVTVFTSSPYPMYSPRVHQLLQLALNIYEATQTNQLYDWPTLPTVMRPVFERRNGEIHITGYINEEIPDFRTRVQNGTLRWYELENAPGSFGLGDNLYDVPILFGARKGMPNFNEFAMNTVSHFSRKVQVEKDPTGTRIVSTNQMLIMSVSNSFVCEFWNSFSNFPNAKLSYPRDLEMQVGVVTTAVLTNTTGLSRTVTLAAGDTFTNRYNFNNWSNGFRLTRVMTNAPLPVSIYYSDPPGPRFQPFDTVTPANNRFEVLQGPTPQWGLQVSNRVVCFLFDGERVVDCYSSSRMSASLNLSRELSLASAQGTVFRRMWDATNGIQTQLDVSGATSPGSLPPADWQDYQDLAGYSTVSASKQGFYNFLNNPTPTQLVHQAGFSPNIRLVQVSSWEANDPLVHYTVLDLYDRTASSSNSMVFRLDPRTPYSIYTNGATSSGISSPGYANKRCNPWGTRQPGSANPSDFNWAEKDPGMYRSDDWDFPTQKFPNLGWLGRVHRGTPWQTIYLKADDPAYSATLTGPAADNGWLARVGAAYMFQTFPTNDWRLLDLFTAAIHPNATRGRLSINQTNLAAWSAVFSGLPASAMISNDPFYDPVETNLQPHSVDLPNTAPGEKTPLLQLVEGINRTRGGRTFSRLADFMAVPELTITSPFLPGDDATQRRSRDYFATDADYEKIPQQILSLVKVGEPRYVVYAWGQSLKPADYTPGIGIGIDPATKVPRNYQITGELATRSVVRVEFDRDANGRTLYQRPRTVTESFNILPNE